MDQNTVRQLTYYKIGNRWFLDMPSYLEQDGDPDDLERIGSFHDFLELIAEGAPSVVLLMSETDFESAEKITLTGSSGEDSGGYYYINEFNGRKMDLELWFNWVIYHKFNGLPPIIYIKKG